MSWLHEHAQEKILVKHNVLVIDETVWRIIVLVPKSTQFVLNLLIHNQILRILALFVP